MDDESAGKVAFIAYMLERQGLSHDGKEVPVWGDLPEGIAAAWEIGALAAIEYFKVNLTLVQINDLLYDWTVKSGNGGWHISGG